MKKTPAYRFAISVVLLTLLVVSTSCGTNAKLPRMDASSNIHDSAGSTCEKSYQITPTVSGQYTFHSDANSSIEITDGNGKTNKSDTSVTQTLKEGADYTLRVTTTTSTPFDVEIDGPQDHGEYMPYRNIFDKDNIRMEINDKVDPLTACEVKYTKRPGGKYIYNNISKAMKTKEQGYIITRGGTDYSKQYKGTDDHLGMIDANLSWTVNDLTPAGKLPVTYKTSYDRAAASIINIPYRDYTNKIYTLNRFAWLTALNPQNDHNAIGTDMMTFRCIDTSGTEHTIDNNHADVPVNLPTQETGWCNTMTTTPLLIQEKRNVPSVFTQKAQSAEH